MSKPKLFVPLVSGVLACLLVLSLIPPANAASSSSEIRNQINALKNQKSQIQQEMEALQSQYEETEDEIANIVGQKNLIDQEIGLLYAQITNINAQITAFNLLIADKQDELEEAQTRFDELSEKNKERIRAMEEEGSLSYWAVLFKASSFADLLDRLNMVEEIAASDQRRLNELGKAAEEVTAARNALEAEKADLEETKKELDAANAELEAKREEADQLLTEMIARSQELEQLYEGFELEEDALMAEIARKEQEYNEAKHQEWLDYMATYTTVPPETTAPPTTAPPTTAPTTEPSETEGEEEDSGSDKNDSGSSNSGSSNSGSSNSGSSSGNNTGSNTGSNTGTSTTVTWLRPCSYIMVSSPFGRRESPTAGASTYHQGIDLAAPAGTPIYATRTGVVTIATYSNSAGWYVSINHGDGYSSIYMHMTSYVVSSGQAVSAGQLIGYVGSTGISTGPHLHFGIAKNGRYVNPAGFISF